MRTVKIAAACAIATIAVLGGAQAKTVTLVVASAAPPVVTYVKATKERFIPEVNKRLAESGLDYEVQWTEAYGQSLAKFTEVFETVEEGIAHVGLILKNFEPSKLKLEQYNYVTPFTGHTTEDMIAIDRNMRKKVPELNKIYEDFNQVFLVSGTSPSMQLYTTFPVESIDDLEGHKIGASGSMGLWLKGTGAVVVNSSMINSYTDLKNGLYDGYPISPVLAFPYRTYEVAKYMTTVDFGVSATSAITVNVDTWNDMPAEVRRIFRDVAKDWPLWQHQIDSAKVDKFLGIMKNKGVKMSTMPQEEVERWANALPNLAKEWADSVEADGLPGREVIKAFMEEVRALDRPIARHWDRDL